MTTAARHCASGDCEEPDSDMKRCARCKQVWYCSTRCQESHWPFHIFDCKAGQPISTVYHLARAMYDDVIPVDKQTRIDYGFDKAESLMDGSSDIMLCGLYQGLLKLDVPLKELRKWQREGTLVEGIKGAFETLPPSCRGGYYPWFLQHQHVLDGRPVDEAAAIAAKAKAIEVRDSMLRAAWRAAGGYPVDASPHDILARLDTFSKERRDCFLFYSLILERTQPHPSQTLWLSFGFVVSRDSGDEMACTRKYHELIGRCTFEEFCEAYNSSAICALFDRHGVSVTPDGPFWGSAIARHFHDVMSQSPRGRKSVWSLKQYVDRLISSSPEDEPTPTPAVVFDYGFRNCKNASERKLLNDLYKQLFQKRGMDPLELHDACVQGGLLEFAKKFVKITTSIGAKYARLLKNSYPLPDPDA